MVCVQDKLNDKKRVSNHNRSRRVLSNYKCKSILVILLTSGSQSSVCPDWDLFKRFYGPLGRSFVLLLDSLHADFKVSFLYFNIYTSNINTFFITCTCYLWTFSCYKFQEYNPTLLRKKNIIKTVIINKK